MDMNPDPHLPNCCYCNMPYYCFPFDASTTVAVVNHHFQPTFTTQQLRYYLPLPYPYTWSADGEVAILGGTHRYDARQLPPSSSTTTSQQLQTMDAVHYIHPYLHSEIVDEVAIVQDLNLDQINQSFQQEAAFLGYSGLTKEVISKNLRLTTIEKQTNYCEEEEAEICVICQVEYENNETLGVLQCKHRYHAECIKEWLLHKNVCPVCKGEALTV